MIHVALICRNHFVLFSFALMLLGRVVNAGRETSEENSARCALRSWQKMKSPGARKSAWLIYSFVANVVNWTNSEIFEIGNIVRCRFRVLSINLVLVSKRNVNNGLIQNYSLCCERMNIYCQSNSCIWFRKLVESSLKLRWDIFTVSVNVETKSITKTATLWNMYRVRWVQIHEITITTSR